MTPPASLTPPAVLAILAQDHHVHSTFSDDATSTVAENLAAATERGLSAVCLTDHVRTDTGWAPQFVRTVRAAAATVDLSVLCGVEAKMLDTQGRLDLPADLPPMDRVLIADHQYPGPTGPVSPTSVRRWLGDGDLSADEAVDTLVLATIRAMSQTASPQLAHLFSLLPKIGLTEAAVHVDQVRALAAAARDRGAVVEVNEKWDCPGPAVLDEFIAAGVAVVASTDSHQAGDIGVYERVRICLAGGGGPA